MRVGDGVAHAGEELEACVERQMPRRAVVVDRLAIDELHGEVRQPVRRQAAVDEASDVGVLEQGENATLLDEATDDARIAVLNELEGDALLELPIGTLGEEDASHAAAADLANDAERADAIGRAASCSGGGLEERRCDRGGGRLERAVRPIRAKQREDFRA